MRKFFSEHPITTIFMSSCLAVVILSLGTVILATTLFIKSARFIAENLETQSSVTTENPIRYSYYYGNKASTNKILFLPITGIILTDNFGENTLTGFLSEATYGYEIKEQLKKAATDSTIKAVILYVNSPGGTIAGAKAIHDGVEMYKDKTGNPVIAYVSGLAASGGYLSILPANRIVADQGSLIGSIGVIMGPFKYYDKVLSENILGSGITTENGIDSYYITAGKSKDFGDPFRQMTPEERKSIQEAIDSEYQWFVKTVSMRRGIETQILTDTIGAMVYDNDKALSLGLIDEIASKDTVFAETAKETGLNDTNYQVVTIKRTDFFSRLFEMTFKSSNMQNKTPVRQLNTEMLFLYGTPEAYQR